MTDLELLQNYAGRGSEAAFRTLVERYLNLVHSVAMRHVQNPQLAEDVSQAVFILLARKAAGLKEGTVLGGWLFQTTRFVAARACRAEQRRQRREQEANEMQLLSTPDQTWKRIAPALDEGLAQLGAADRNLVLLRFYEGKSHSEAGAALGLSEEAARKRGARALEKLRAWFTKRGTVLSATGLAAAMTANAVQAAPTELASGILAATAKATGAAALPELVRETLNAWRWLKLKVATACVIPGVAIVLLAIAMQQPKGTLPATSGKPNLVSSVGVSVTPQADAQAAVSKVENKASGNLRLHVVAKDSGEAIGRAMLALVGVPNWEQTYNFVTDDKGVCDIPLAADLERLVVGVLSPGWEARFVTWKPAQDDPVPAEYTLKVERVTNSIGGWLQDASGKGIENAQVWIQFGNGDYSARETPREQSGVLFPAPVATSDRDGRWSCAVIPNKETSFSLEAKHPNFARTSIASSWPEPIEPKEEREKVRQLWAGTLITTLGQGLELQGRVTDEAGRPIAGARIEHKPAEEGGASLRAGADGQFAFSKLNTGEFEIVASAEGFAPEVRKVQIGQQSAPLDIVLKPGALLRLRLVDKNETPVPGATVVLERWGDRSAPAHWRIASGPDGRIESHSAPRNEELELCAHKEGWCFTRQVQVTADGEEHTIVMTPALTLVGRVTVAGTGEPIEDFKVVPGYGEGSGEQVWERLDSRRGNKGEFKMVFSESNQPWRMRVEAGGYEQAIAGPIPTDFQGVYEIALKKADANAAFRGVVLLPDGEPAAGAGVALLTLDYGVQLMPGGFRNQGVGILTNADAAGSFAFAVDPRAHSVVAVSAAGFVKLRVKNTAKPLTLKLQPWGRIEGTLAERERHQPIDALDLMDDAAMNYPGSVTLDFNAFQAKPDAEGHFAFDRVPPGHFSLYLNRAMGTPLTCRTLVEVRPGESTAVTIGGEGRTVIGKLLAVGVRPEEWRKPDTMATLAPKSDPLPYPEILNAAEAGFWSVDFWQSQAGLDHLNRNRGYGLGLASNGTFRSEGVQPGKYQLWAQVGKLWVDKEVTVPEIPAAGDGEVDLGSFNLVKRSETEAANEK